MNHFLNVLAGFGSAINPFGTAPEYKLPKIGDRSVDAERIASDFKVVGKRLEKKTTTALSENYESINHDTGTR